MFCYVMFFFYENESGRYISIWQIFCDNISNARQILETPKKKKENEFARSKAEQSKAKKKKKNYPKDWRSSLKKKERL